jgi:hypothetical protein
MSKLSTINGNKEVQDYTETEAKAELMDLFERACKVAEVPLPPEEIKEKMAHEIMGATMTTAMRAMELGEKESVVLVAARHIRTTFECTAKQFSKGDLDSILDEMRGRNEKPNGPAGYL